MSLSIRAFAKWVTYQVTSAVYATSLAMEDWFLFLCMNVAVKLLLCGLQWGLATLQYARHCICDGWFTSSAHVSCSIVVHGARGFRQLFFLCPLVMRRLCVEGRFVQDLVCRIAGALDMWSAVQKYAKQWLMCCGELVRCRWMQRPQRASFLHFQFRWSVSY